MMAVRCRSTALTIALTAALVTPLSGLRAQDADLRPTTPDSSKASPNTTAGEFTPATGFTVIKTDRGSLNISVYGLFRYINQMPAGQTFLDHLGRRDSINTRNDLNWHRTMIWISGFFYDPKFRYTITAWSLPTTQQTLVFGNMQYLASKYFNAGVGIAPSLTARSLQGSWPFWAASDRLMAEEFFRGGFASGLWVTGEPLTRLTYTLSINNNISELGVVQSNDTRDLMYTASLRWQPTTGEFGPRGGFGDLEYHTHLATQFGVSGGKSRESRYAPLDQPPNNTQIKLSDGINPFDFGALADSVTVRALNYQELAIDAGVKYRGFSYESEYFFRTLSHFIATGPLPVTTIYDNGFFAEAMYMAIPKTLGVYVVGERHLRPVQAPAVGAGRRDGLLSVGDAKLARQLAPAARRQVAGVVVVRLLPGRAHGDDLLARRGHPALSASQRTHARAMRRPAYASRMRRPMHPLSTAARPVAG